MREEVTIAKSVTTVRAVRIERRREMAGKYPEDPDPDRDMEHAVIVLVLLTLDDFFHE
jgi:hypothetical protein